MNMQIVMGSQRGRRATVGFTDELSDSELDLIIDIIIQLRTGLPGRPRKTPCGKRARKIAPRIDREPSADEASAANEDSEQEDTKDEIVDSVFSTLKVEDSGESTRGTGEQRPAMLKRSRSAEDVDGRSHQDFFPARMQSQ